MSDKRGIEQLMNGFFESMHDWEKRCLPHIRKLTKGEMDPDDAEELEIGWLREIFKEYCVEWDSPGRGATYGDPPTYEPAKSAVQSVDIDGDKATVSVLHRSELLGDEIVQYFVHKTDRGWRLEDRRRHLDTDGKVVQEWNTL